MCINADVNFAAAAVIGAVGVATLRHVREPRAVLFAAVPLLFALHQFTEGFVWLGVRGQIPPDALGHMTFLFILYAQGILPFLMPLGVLLIEPRAAGSVTRWGWRTGAIGALTLLGAALAAYVLYALIAYESHARVVSHSLNYDNPATANGLVAGVYVLATCGSLVLSTHRVVRWFGLFNLAGVVVTLLLKSYAFTSVWCLYAAIISVMLYWLFRAGHVDVVHPNSRLEGAAA